ncbi:5-oxoprolinase subunit PxpA [Cysteiniphilum halobium]|uniref:5-oxoprolinase subunit PxpA n=1 Tax=Cysteiniphilum halobium TaxID=2219059 RepID=UPI003F836907
MRKIDLNCDMGEGFGCYQICHNEAELMQKITSVNIACGYHAGDPHTMRETVTLAIKHGVHIGAHPGFPDLLGFGRRVMSVSAQEVYDYVLYQVGALEAVVRAQGAKLHHVKPHGALYNMAAKDSVLANAIAQAVYDFDQTLLLYGLSGSDLITAAKEKGLAVANEVFADRTYQDNGQLTPRNQANCYVATTKEALQQVTMMVEEGAVISVNKRKVAVAADTVCVHGDGDNALDFACKLYNLFVR